MQLLSEIAYWSRQQQGGRSSGADDAADTGKSRAAAGLVPEALLESLAQLHYLDVGLNCRGAYQTDPGVLEGVGTWAAQHPLFGIHLHGSPRQWADATRPWIAQEKARMTAACAAANVPLAETLYFRGEKPSLLQHFNVLRAFVTDS